MAWESPYDSHFAAQKWSGYASFKTEIIDFLGERIFFEACFNPHLGARQCINPHVS